MRSSWKIAVAVGLLVLPQLAAADENVEEQLLQMQERMNQLEEKLAATSDQLEDSQRRVDEQEQVIQRAGLEERSAASGIASFFEQVEFGGWVAASYWYNFNDHGPGSNFNGFPNQGTFGLAYPFHPDTNTFQLDQLWFEMKKAATEDSRGGFAADLVMGKTSDFLVGGGGDGNGNNVTVYQAYAEWLAPLGPGVSLKGGRFATHVGAEVAQTVYNFNITRGLVYSVLQPVNHVGIKAETEFENGFSLMLGGSNTSFSNANTDFDNTKSLLWSVGYSQESWGLKLNGIWGGDTPGLGPKCGGGTGGVCRDSDDVGLVDLVINWDPSENLATWIDVTYDWLSNSQTIGADPWGVGVAAAGRLAITEATGFAIRFEYLYANDDLLGVPGAPANADEQLYGITGTIDHALTENLIVKAEARYDTGTINARTNDDVFFNEGAWQTTQDQVTVGAEMSYRF